MPLVAAVLGKESFGESWPDCCIWSLLKALMEIQEGSKQNSSLAKINPFLVGSMSVGR